MPLRALRLQRVAPRTLTASRRWAVLLVRALVLLALTLLPVQMRAGASDAHPHSLLQLALDARDGSIDHHVANKDLAHAHENDADDRAICPTNPDIPSVEETGRIGGGIPMLSAAVLLMLLPARAGDAFWPAPHRWRGQMLTLEPPPPRIRRI